MEKKLNMDILDDLANFETKILAEIKSIDTQITSLRESRQKLSNTVRAINPDALRRKKKS